MNIIIICLRDVWDGGIKFSARRPACPTDVYHVNLQSLETCGGIVLEVRLRLPPTTSCLILYELTVVSFNIIRVSSELLTVLLNEGLCCMELIG
jgi:hypothetical protein